MAVRISWVWQASILSISFNRLWSAPFRSLPKLSDQVFLAVDRRGVSTAFALDNLQKRGEMFVGPGAEVYEGMIVGEASRPDEMVVNVTKGKELTNIRTHASDEAIKLRPPRQLGLESAMEWIADDELVEVTPDAIRVRKRYLGENERRKNSKKSGAGVG